MFQDTVFTGTMLFLLCSAFCVLRSKYSFSPQYSFSPLDKTSQNQYHFCLRKVDDFAKIINAPRVGRPNKYWVTKSCDKTFCDPIKA